MDSRNLKKRMQENHKMFTLREIENNGNRSLLASLFLYTLPVGIILFCHATLQQRYNIIKDKRALDDWSVYL